MWSIFCKIKAKSFTLHNLHTFEKKTSFEPPTPVKRKSSSSSTKSKSKGLSQKERDLLEYLKDDPNMRQIVLQNILDKKEDSDDDTVSSAASSSPSHHKPEDRDYQDPQEPFDY